VDAGDVVLYTTTIAHSGTSTSAAYDVELRVTFDTGAHLVLQPPTAWASTSPASSSVTWVSGTAGGDRIVVVRLDKLVQGESLTLQYAVVVNASVTPQLVLDSTARVTWDSSPFSTLGQSGRVGSAPPVVVSMLSDLQTRYTQSVVALLSPLHSGPLDLLVVGELVTYRVTLSLPEGTSPDVRVTVDLPFGGSASDGKLGVVPGNLLHLWHGDLVDRRYAEMNQQFATFDFNPNRDLRHDENGLWEWNEASPELQKWATDFFWIRREDGDPDAPLQQRKQSRV
jgi:hypothetical protein